LRREIDLVPLELALEKGIVRYSKLSLNDYVAVQFQDSQIDSAQAAEQSTYRFDNYVQE
jgi:hypothetical protein